MAIKHPVVYAAAALLMASATPAWAGHFAAAWVDQEPPWGIHRNALPYDQHHTHGLVLFERIHGVEEHLPFFVVRTPGVYNSIRVRTIHLAERMDLAMDMVTEGGQLFVEPDGRNYAIYAQDSDEQRRRKLRVITITPADAAGYARRSDPHEISSLSAADLARYIVDYWFDMYLVFFKFEDPRYLLNTDPGKQILGMMKWSRNLARSDGVELTLESLHQYIDMLPGNRPFKEALESLVYYVPNFHGGAGHGEEPEH